MAIEDDRIKSINDAIQRLRELKGQFSDTSRQAQQLDRIIATISSRLDSMSARSLNTLSAQFEKLFSSIESRTSERIRLAGTPVRTAQFRSSQPVQSLGTEIPPVIPNTVSNISQLPNSRANQFITDEEIAALQKKGEKYLQIEEDFLAKDARLRQERIDRERASIRRGGERSLASNEATQSKLEQEAARRSTQEFEAIKKSGEGAVEALDKVNQRYDKLRQARIDADIDKTRRVGESTFDADAKRQEELASRAARESSKKATQTQTVGEQELRAYEELLRRQDQIQARRTAKKAEETQRIGERELDIYEESARKSEQRTARASTKEAEKDLQRLQRLGESALDTYDKLIQRHDELMAGRATSKGEKLITPEIAANVLPGGMGTTNRAFETAQNIDPRFTPETLKRIESFGNSASRMSFQFSEADGVVRKLNLSVDKFGSILVEKRRNLQSFGEALAKDMQEFLKWSIAIALVYGPLEKLSELTQIMIKNQSTLADVTIAVGDAQLESARIFEEVADAADDAGESLDGVLQGYSLAYRAIGESTDANARFVSANKLLSDSLILSKLSTMDQMEATDALSAAIRQTGGDFNKGSELIDKWVRVSKVANVDIATLATGFAVLGDAAESAGMDTDDLNAVLASVAETGVASGKEVANTARALVSGIQSDQSRKELQALGISVVDSTGKMRNFLEIINQIKELKSQGIIDDTQFSKLTLALGGGTRRQAAYATFIENISRTNQIIKSSAGAGGDAEEALGQKLNTVETSVTRLGNAFQQLAQSMGTSGGVLDSMKVIIDGATQLVNILTKLTDVLGKTGPLLAATFAAKTFVNLRYPGSSFSNLMQSNLASGLGLFMKGTDPNATKQVFTGEGMQTVARQRSDVAASNIMSFFNTPSFGRNLAVGAGIGAIAGAGQVLGEEKDFARAGMDIAGGIIGALIAKGDPVGAAIGVSIADSFYSGLLKYENNFQNFFTPMFEEGATEAKGGKKLTEAELLQKQAEDELFRAIGPGGNRDLGQTLAKIVAGGATAIGTGYSAISGIRGDLLKKGMPEFIGSAFGKESTGFTGVTAQQAALAWGKMFGVDVSKQTEMVGKAYAFQEAKRGVESKYFKEREAGVESTVRPTMETTSKEFIAILQEQLMQGDITTSKYRSGYEQLGKLSALGTQAYTTFGRQYQEQFGGGTPEFSRAIGRISAYGTQEQIEQMSQYITDLSTNLSDLDATAEVSGKSSQEYNDKLKEYNELARQAAYFTREMNDELLSRISMPTIEDLSEYQRKDSTMIVDKAIELQSKDIQASIENKFFTKEEADAYIRNLPTFLLADKEGYMRQEKLDSKYIQQAEKDLKQSGALTSAKDMGFMELDVKQSQYMKQVEPYYEPLKNRLQEMGVKIDEQSMAVAFKDGVIQPMTKDWKIVQYLLQKILDTEQKALGVYNLPEGMSFYVPFQGYKEGFGKSGGAITKVLDLLKKDYETKPKEEKKPEPVIKENLFPQKDVLGPDMKAVEDREKIKEIITDPKRLERQNLFDEWGSNKQPTTKTQEPAMQFVQSIGDTIKNITTKLSLNITMTSNLNVDGRQLANIVKPFLLEDMIRYNSGGGNRNFTM